MPTHAERQGELRAAQSETDTKRWREELLQRALEGAHRADLQQRALLAQRREDAIRSSQEKLRFLEARQVAAQAGRMARRSDESAQRRRRNARPRSAAA